MAPPFKRNLSPAVRYSQVVENKSVSPAGVSLSLLQDVNPQKIFRVVPTTLDDEKERIRRQNPLEDYLPRRGIDLKQAGKELLGVCPLCDDQSGHLYVNVDTQLFFCQKCRVGGDLFAFVEELDKCGFKEALAKLGGQYGANGEEENSLPPPPNLEEMCRYTYQNEEANPHFQAVKYWNNKKQKKEFRYCKPDGRWGIEGIRRVLYHLPEVIAAQEVWVTEGEKDADNLRKYSVVATTNPMGAGNWLESYTETLRGKAIVICGDNDQSEAKKGQKHVAMLQNTLSSVALSIRTVQLPEEFKDVSDLLESLHSDFERIETLERLRLDAKEIPNPVIGRLLLDFRHHQPNPENTLLGNRFLCRGAGMLFVGPSGMGKSSASVQQDIQWSMGRLSFGIKPGKALKILTIQAEDDDGDTDEMVQSVCNFLKITEEEEKKFRSNCSYIGHKSLTGHEFIAFVRRALEYHHPDILRLNPLQAYIGADIKDPAVTAAFLRSGLNPLLEEFNCAVIIVHHTPKTNFRDTDEWRASDWMYAGAGSADITNWARAILIADPTENPQVFQWIAAKRGKRIGWADKDGNPTTTRYFSHSSADKIHWDDTEPVDIPEKKTKQTKTVNTSQAFELLPHPPFDIFRTEFAQLLQDRLHVGVNKAKELIAILLETNQATLIKKPRPNTKPAEFLQRSEREISTADQNPIPISQ
jgi:hypothetical protein